MEQITKEAISLCGAVDLLAAIFEKDHNHLRLRYGLPVTYPACFECGKKLDSTNKWGYCRECWAKSRLIKVVCSECGQLFEITQSELITRTKRHKLEQMFCHKHCWGKYVARSYGFIAHPENGRRGNLKKWDCDKVYELRNKTGWGSHRISRALGMSRSTVDYILYGKRKLG